MSNWNALHNVRHPQMIMNLSPDMWFDILNTNPIDPYWSLKGPLLIPEGSPSITREVRREFSFFDENVTFFDFLIDLLSVLN